MQQNAVTVSAYEVTETGPEAWAKAGLKVAEQEIRRLQRLGYVPYTLNADDLRSEANEILAGIVGAPEDHVRRLLRCRLIDCIKREFMKQRQELPIEMVSKGSVSCIGTLEFHQLTANLTEKQREAVILFYITGESAESAAELLGITRQVFFRRLETALQSIRKIFFSDGYKIPC